MGRAAHASVRNYLRELAGGTEAAVGDSNRGLPAMGDCIMELIENKSISISLWVFVARGAELRV